MWLVWSQLRYLHYLHMYINYMYIKDISFYPYSSDTLGKKKQIHR